jgi:hypothetical protein
VRRSARMLSLVNLVVGVWVLLSPWLLGFSGFGRPAWNAAATGLRIAAIAAAAAMGAMRRWPGQRAARGLAVRVAVGAQHPAVETATSNAVISGAVVIVVAAITASDDRTVQRPPTPLGEG